MLILWHVTVSEDHDIDDINGECDSKDTLSDVEILIENFENEHASTMACSRQRNTRVASNIASDSPTAVASSR